jgi:hypothetical protein
MSILDRIDRAISGLCECGCGQPLPENGPSMYFASEDCQQRWRARRTRDAQDNGHEDLRRAEEEGARRLTPARAEPNTSTRAHTLTALQWARRCPNCNRHGIPVEGRRAQAARAQITPGDTIPLETDPCHACPHCLTPYPGPPLRASVSRYGSIILAEVSTVGAEQVTEKKLIADVEIGSIDDPESYIQGVWNHLADRVATTARVREWLRANGVDPNRVPRDARITTTRSMAIIETVVVDENGRVVFDQDSPRLTTQAVLLNKPWPANLHYPNHVNLGWASILHRGFPIPTGSFLPSFSAQASDSGQQEQQAED